LKIFLHASVAAWAFRWRADGSPAAADHRHLQPAVVTLTWRRKVDITSARRIFWLPAHFTLYGAGIDNASTAEMVPFPDLQRHRIK
jgi:hypothetical protein